MNRDLGIKPLLNSEEAAVYLGLSSAQFGHYLGKRFHVRIYRRGRTKFFDTWDLDEVDRDLLRTRTYRRHKKITRGSL